jgi:hypothetical protein
MQNPLSAKRISNGKRRPLRAIFACNFSVGMRLPIQRYRVVTEKGKDKSNHRSFDSGRRGDLRSG